MAKKTEAAPPPGTVQYEVWEGRVNYDGERQWPPTKRVRAWIAKDAAERCVDSYTLIEENAATLVERSPEKYYVAVEVRMTRRLA